MVFNLRYGGPIRRGATSIATRDGIYVYGMEHGGEAAAGRLMELALSSHASVVVFAKKPDYYRFVKDSDIRWQATFTSKELTRESSYPWFRDLSGASVTAMRNVFEQAGMGRELISIKSRTKNGWMAVKPGLALSFYQIRDRGSKPERIASESLVTGLLTEAALREGVREEIFFYEAPYKPSTEAGIRAARIARDEGVALIGLFKDDGDGFDKGSHGITCSDGVTILKDGSGRKHRIIL